MSTTPIVEDHEITVVYNLYGSVSVETDIDLAIPKSIAAMGGAPKELRKSLTTNWEISPESPAMFRFILRLCEIEGITDITVHMRNCTLHKHWLASGQIIIDQVLTVLKEEYKLTKPKITYRDQLPSPPMTQAELEDI